MPSPPTETAKETSDLGPMLADALAVIAVAERSFEHEGDGNVLAEALRAAAEEFGVLGAALSNPMNPDRACFLRAEIRCGLALAIHEFREKHDLHGSLTSVVRDG
jgi:hypothetical protein